MAYLAREQSIKAWASLVTNNQVNSLKQIQQPKFLMDLLVKLDPKYFNEKFANVNTRKQLSIPQIYHSITKYYSTEIGTNIKHIIAETVNLSSQQSTEDAWELMIGIAIKGNYRQDNINVILKMDDNNQEQLMRIVSKVIGILGENASLINGVGNSGSIIQGSSFSPNNNDMLLQISEQNQHLKQRIEELCYQISNKDESITNLKKQFEQNNNFKTSLLEIMLYYDSQISPSHSYQQLSPMSRNIHNKENSIMDFVKDVIKQAQIKNKQLQFKQQKVSNLEEMIKDLKLAYSASLVDLEEYRKSHLQSLSTIEETERSLEHLRKENVDYLQREKQSFAKIEELNQQKYYLKSIVERMEKQTSFSPQKLDELISLKIKEQKNSTKKDRQSLESNTSETEKYQFSLQGVQKRNNEQGQKQDPQLHKTVKYQINETLEPSMRNKLQREVSHLQKKINSLSSQNQSLKNINAVLENAINQFTKNSKISIDKIEEQYKSKLTQFQEQLKALVLQNKSDQLDTEQIKQIENKLTNFTEQFKQQVQRYQNKQNNYKQLILKLERQRDSLLKLITEDLSINDRQVIAQKESEEKINGNSSVILQEFVNQMPQIIVHQPNGQLSPTKYKKETNRIVQQDLMTNIIEVKQTNNTLQIQKISKQKITIKGSILQNQDDQQLFLNRRKQYSYMGNRKSELQNQHLGFAQKYTPNKSIMIESDILQQESQHQYHVEDDENSRILDVTEIEEDLQKIREKFVSLSTRQQQIYLESMNHYKAGMADKQDKQKNISQPNSMIQKMLQKLNKVMLNDHKEAEEIFKVNQSTQLIKITHQNKALKAEVAVLLKERNSLKTILKKYQQINSHENSNNIKNKQDKINAEQLQGIISKAKILIVDFERIFNETNHSYMQLQKYFENNERNDDKKLNRTEQKEYCEFMELKLINLQKQVNQAQQLILNLHEQNKLLIGAMLEWRNIANMSSQSISSDMNKKNQNIKNKGQISKKINLNLA